MNRIIKINQPENLERNNSWCFKNINYKLSPLKIFELSNVLITHQGICVINSDVVKESLHGYRDQITIDTLIVKKDLLNFKTILLSDSSNYLIIHSQIFSYYNWITESIPRLLMVKSRVKDLTLLLPFAYKDISFINESLEPFHFKNIFFIPNNKNIKVRHLVLPQLKPFFSSYFPDVVNEVRKLYSEFLKGKNINGVNVSERIFIDNKTMSELDNIREIHQIMDQYKISTINFSDFSFYEKVEMMQNCKLLISFGDDGMTCTSFMNKGTSTLEFIKRQNDYPCHLYLKYLNLTSNLDIKYYYQFLLQIKEKNPIKPTKFYVDPVLFRKNINLILENN
jgi:hypothetical protein